MPRVVETISSCLLARAFPRRCGRERIREDHAHSPCRRPDPSAIFVLDVISVVVPSGVHGDAGVVPLEQAQIRSLSAQVHEVLFRPLRSLVEV